MKKLKLRKWVVDSLGIILFYSLIVLGVVLINNRCEQLCENGYKDYCLVEVSNDR